MNAFHQRYVQMAKSFSSYSHLTRNGCKGVFLVSAKNAFVPEKRDNSVNTYSRI